MDFCFFRQAISADGHDGVVRLEFRRLDFNPSFFAQASLHRRLRRFVALDQRDELLPLSSVTTLSIGAARQFV